MHLHSILLPLILAISATAHSPAERPHLTATAREILRAENGSWFENLAVRRNGKLLVTRLDKPSLYEVDPETSKYSIVARWTNVSAAVGIVEYAPDVFAVGVGNFSRETFTGIAGTQSIQILDLSKKLKPGEMVIPRLLANIPDAVLLNGLAFRAPSTIYAADSFAYKIWSVDARSGLVGTAVPTHPLLQSTPEGKYPAGVNGLKWDEFRKQLIFTNTNQVLIGRARLNAATAQFETPELIAGGIAGTVDFDDLDFDHGGALYAANGLRGVNYLSQDGSMQYLIPQKDNLTLYSPTATIFGRGRQSNILYITTSGLNPEGQTVGGQIAAYSFPGFR